jgi:hypothetical protein
VTMHDHQVPPALRDRISRDLAPVSPLPSPLRRAAAIVPIGLGLLVASVLIFGLRRDAPMLGLALTWGASALQMCVGLALSAAALREAVPGSTLSSRLLGSLVIAAFALVLIVTWMTWLASPTVIAPHAVVRVWQVCFVATVVTSLPPLALTGWLVARAFALRPSIAGSLCGLGAGLMADAGWRLFCGFSDPTHVAGAHTLGIAAACVVGGLGARLLRRR